MNYKVNKGSNLDKDGRNLYNYLHNNLNNVANIIIIDNGPSTLENCFEMFNMMTNIKYLDISNLNISNSKNNERFIANCYNLQEVELPDLTNINRFAAFFEGCSSLNYFPIEPKDFKDNASYGWIYSKCYNIPSIDISNIAINNSALQSVFYTVNLNSIYNINANNCNMYSCFSRDDYAEIRGLTAIHDLHFTNCNLHRLFVRCRNLSTVDNVRVSGGTVSEFLETCSNLSVLTNITIDGASTTQYAFSYWQNSNMDIQNVLVTNIGKSYRMFHSSKVIDMHNIVMSNIKNMGWTFEGCGQMSEIPVLNMDGTTYVRSMFVGCNNLSRNSYSRIANYLPSATQFTNRYITNLGLNTTKFTQDEINIMLNKGYLI